MSQSNYQGISPTDPSTWDSNTESLNLLYSTDLTGDIIADVFLTTSVPDNTWDEADTAGVGQEFAVGSFVQNTITDTLYRCLNASTNAAVWTIILQERI